MIMPGRLEALPLLPPPAAALVPFVFCRSVLGVGVLVEALDPIWTTPWRPSRREQLVEINGI